MPDDGGLSALSGIELVPRRRCAWLHRLSLLLREPLVHFLAAGAALSVIVFAHQAWMDPHRIIVTKAHVAQLANAYALQFGARPDPRTLDALVARDIHDEILFRQGKALKLDQDDEIVRRRITQKMQFLTADLKPPSEPTEADLQAFYAAHASRYTTPALTTFTHIYFSSDVGGDARGEARARTVLGGLTDRVARAPERGDPYPDLYDFSGLAPDQIERLFGRSALSAALLAAPIGHWAGPFRSGYGWHLVRVDARQLAERPGFERVRDRVRTDYLESLQDAGNQAAFETVARDYHVVRQDQPGAR